VAEVVNSKLRLPAGPDAGFRAGHDRCIVDEDVHPAPGIEEPPGESVDAVEVSEIKIVDLYAVEPVKGLLGMGRRRAGTTTRAPALARTRTVSKPSPE